MITEGVLSRAGARSENLQYICNLIIIFSCHVKQCSTAYTSQKQKSSTGLSELEGHIPPPQFFQQISLPYLNQRSRLCPLHYNLSPPPDFQTFLTALRVTQSDKWARFFHLSSLENVLICSSPYFYMLQNLLQISQGDLRILENQSCKYHPPLLNFRILKETLAMNYLFVCINGMPKGLMPLFQGHLKLSMLI